MLMVHALHQQHLVTAISPQGLKITWPSFRYYGAFLDGPLGGLVTLNYDIFTSRLVSELHVTYKTFTSSHYITSVLSLPVFCSHLKTLLRTLLPVITFVVPAK